ncbi:hypothetical protein FA95DRAFT_1508286 [Auriscalpium vulgare]|uniref:Uncharacterized protein n=1 Tax=Auriscalpium vulgare TaxID=40419 RepID=A0ACB8SBA9_9AGAM|nr:hypothetical protein FA95DRAFT_1508286 [Auriscalpium vulgare]
MHRSNSTPIPPSRPSSRASSLRPPSSASSVRPSSSASLRPPSSASQRPSSSASTNRPTSSASVRPVSRVSHRPASRFSQRPPTRQSSRIQALSQTLVTQVTGLSPENDEDNFRTAAEYVSKTIEHPHKASPSASLDAVEKHLHGLTLKARINSSETWADAVDACYTQVKGQATQKKDLDDEITLSRLPDHLQLLILLSLPPSQPTLEHAESHFERLRNPTGVKPSLTWEDILAEEPFEGQHWEGVYGLPPGSTVEGWETRSLDSTPPLSPLPLTDDFPRPRSLSPMESSESEELRSSPTWPLEDQTPSNGAYSHRTAVEDLKSRQYWRAEWRTDASLHSEFNIGDASSLGPSSNRALGEGRRGSIKEKYIHEHDAVREVLMALQGYKNVILKWEYREGSNFSFELATDAPRVVHLTLTAQASILASFAHTATTIEHLRKSIVRVFQAAQTGESSRQPSHLSGYHRRVTLTVEAFADAVDGQIRTFNSWCAAKEQDICLANAGQGPPLVVSFLSLEKMLRDTFADTFDALLDIARLVLQRTSRTQDLDVEVWTLAELPAKSPPSVVTALLLDSLLTAAQDHLLNGDIVTSDALMQVFMVTAEPVWFMIGQWLKDGMPIQDLAERRSGSGLAHLDDEFFIEDNELVLLDPDFWKEGYALRDGSTIEENASKAVPLFLEPIASYILSAGKANGLLRAMDINVDPDKAFHWPTFRGLLENPTGDRRRLLSLVDDLSGFVFDNLLLRCQQTQGQLAHVVVDECDLWPHLTAIENVFLMRRGDVMARFSETLFAKMDANQPWTDFHVLNSAFRDTVHASSHVWIDASLVRLSYRGGHGQAASRTMRSFDGLLAEYAAPFPLAYAFDSRALEVYRTIFVFLLQMHRAKSVLNRILVRGAAADIARQDVPLKVLYAMRSKFSWFVNTMFDFIATHVLHARLLKFHASLRLAKSLDDIIALHEDHLKKLEAQCLLQGSTSSLHRAIISILDLSLQFNDCFIAFAGDTTLDTSRQSLAKFRSHRSRRLRKQRKNTIGFSVDAQDVDLNSDTDSDEDGDIEGTAPESSFVFGVSASFTDDGFVGTIQKMSSELNGLVRFVRRGAEKLAAGSTEASTPFGILAFLLEDWDR